jgi:hypothetical protein
MRMGGGWNVSRSCLLAGCGVSIVESSGSTAKVFMYAYINKYISKHLN